MINISGRNISAYNYNNMLLPDLLKNILNDFPDKNVVISHLNPEHNAVVSGGNDLMENICQMIIENDRLQPNNEVILSAQSLSNEVLYIMKKNVTVEYITNLINNFPQIKFALNIIVGHPGETDELFEETYDYICNYKNKEHTLCFSYLDFINTDSYTFDNKVPKDVIDTRSKRINSLCDSNYRMNNVYSALSMNNSFSRSKIRSIINNKENVVGFVINPDEVDKPSVQDCIDLLIYCENNNIKFDGFIYDKPIFSDSDMQFVDVFNMFRLRKNDRL